MVLLFMQSERYWNICWAITASSGHITIMVVWHQTKASADIGLAITMWPKLVDHYTKVLVWGRSQSSLDTSYIKIRKELSRFVKTNGLPSEMVDVLSSKIVLKTELDKLGDCNFYIEAISEDFEAKVELISKLRNYVSENATVATNTSQLSVTALAMKVSVPANFIGMFGQVT